MQRLSAYLWRSAAEHGTLVPWAEPSVPPEPLDPLPQLLTLERLLAEIKGEISAVHGRLDRLDRALARIVPYASAKPRESAKKDERITKRESAP
jgi:hypothetical protein